MYGYKPDQSKAGRPRRSEAGRAGVVRHERRHSRSRGRRRVRRGSSSARRGRRRRRVGRVGGRGGGVRRVGGERRGGGRRRCGGCRGRRRRCGRAADGNRELHAGAAVPGDAANEVVAAGCLELHGRCAAAVGAERLGCRARHVLGRAHLHHRVQTFRVVEN
jgi:hypothetical protein